MGGTHGEVRGRRKIDAYLEYAAMIEQVGETLPDQYPSPHNKKRCKKLMVQDPDTGEWVLHYHLHT